MYGLRLFLHTVSVRFHGCNIFWQLCPVTRHLPLKPSTPPLIGEQYSEPGSRLRCLDVSLEMVPPHCIGPLPPMPHLLAGVVPGHEQYPLENIHTTSKSNGDQVSEPAVLS